MSKKKLTLSVDEAAVEHARRFSRRNRTTISRLVTDFLASLDDGVEGASPIVDRLTGLMRPDATRDDYRRHLDEKHG